MIDEMPLLASSFPPDLTRKTSVLDSRWVEGMEPQCFP